MNRTFKTLWNKARRSYIVANEAQRAHGKSAKGALTLAVVSAALFSTMASASYVETAFVAKDASQVVDAKASWETEEYQKDWGLGALHASTAYALGFHGQNTAVGVMDSGALLQAHPELAGDRFHASHNKGEYGSSGVRYPQGALPQFDADYEAGEAYDITGDWKLNVNDSHGTHVTGTVGANRDGNEFHGVSWGSDIHVGNTGGTDDSNYGPFLDYQFFKNGWGQLAQDIIATNGEKRGGVINNSFGTNTRVVANRTSGADGGNTSVHLPVNTVSQSEYEFFMFHQMYGENRTFVDAAYDAVKGTNVVQIMTTGNRDMRNPYYRALYPYFNPEAENQWIAVAGLRKSGDKYKLYNTFNEAGLAKYWTIAAPANGIYSSAVVDGSYLNATPEKPLGTPTYAAWSGTSMAAPHVAGSMGVLMSRYQDMSAIQVRDVLFTTANHKNPDGSNFEGWNNVDGTTPAEGEVSDRMGWGIPDLEKGMYGVGQLLGHFDYVMSTTELDVWSNDVSQVALDQRQREDMAWKAAAEKWLAHPTLTLGENFTEEEKKLLGNVLLDTADDLVGIDADKEAVSEEDAIKWRTEYYNKRLAGINAKIEQGLYNGSLTKRGVGTLVLTGNNTYRGGTTVEEGTLLGFAESFGVTRQENNRDTDGNGKVTVNGGVFGVMNKYNDTFTMKGELTSDADADHSVDIAVNRGGTYGVVAGQDVNVGTLTFAEGAGITLVSADKDVLVEAYKGNEVKGSVTAESIEGADKAVANPDYAFFDTDFKVDEASKTLTASLTRNDQAIEGLAASGTQAAVASALVANTGSAVFGDLVDASKNEIRSTLASLGSDLHLAAQNATIVDSASLARTIKDQANAFGMARHAELGNGAQLWATGSASWTDVDAGGASVDGDVDYYAGFIGAELPYGDGNKVGVFFGYGSTDFDASADGKVESDDLHIGMYGQNDFEKVGVTYGFAYTTQDRDSKRNLVFRNTVGANAVSYDANVFQLFGEVSYKGLNTDAYQVEPYAGLSYFRTSADSFNEHVAGHNVKTELEDQNIGALNLGVRGAMPFTAGSVAMKVKADVGYTQFFGDKEATAKMTIGDAGTAKLKGEELSGMGTVGLGIDAALSKNVNFGVNYTGAFGSDITSHGVGANLRIKF